MCPTPASEPVKAAGARPSAATLSPRSPRPARPPPPASPASPPASPPAHPAAPPLKREEFVWGGFLLLLAAWLGVLLVGPATWAPAPAPHPRLRGGGAAGGWDVPPRSLDQLWAAASRLAPEPPPPDFAAALAARASPARDVVLSFVSAAGEFDFARDWITHWHCSLRRNGADAHHLAVCVDDEAEAAAAAAGVPYFPARGTRALLGALRARRGGEHPALRSWDQVLNAKPLVALRALQAGYNVLWSDLDVVYFQDPVAAVRQVYSELSPAPDALFTLDSLASRSRSWNTGVYYAPATPKVLHAFAAWVMLSIEAMEEEGSAHDQRLFQSAIASHLHIQPLSPLRWPCGIVLRQRGDTVLSGGSRPWGPGAGSVMLHVNHMWGPEVKRSALQRNGLWLLDKNGTCRLPA